GQSLLPAIGGGKIPARSFYVESLFAHEVLGCAPLAGVIDKNHKYLRLPRPEIYDLEADPAERDNLYSPADGRAREMESALAACESRFGSSDFSSLRKISPEEKKRLESLGYLASGPGFPSKKSEADPKDRVEFWNRSQEARRLVAANRYGEAEPLLLSLYHDDPRFGAVLEDIAEIYFKQNRPAALTAFFDAAVNRDPENAALRLLYAMYLVRFDLPGRAVGILEGADESIDIRDREMFYFVLGNAYGRMMNYQEAAEALRKALEIEPDNYEAARLLGFTLMQLGRYSDALGMLGRAERGLPDNPRLLEDKAMAHANLKEFGLARKYFEKVLAIAPAARIYANYALTFAEEGDYAKARAWMSKVLSARDLDEELKREGLQFLRTWPDSPE
ncbi:MAG: tetratricopeptide repeat protein, partial [Acidobacteriota bacterium]|nr:tetratricopeptide repeat protein [Acidobacteriota bacterium]